MNNITFLLGAGASYNALPIVKDIAGKLQMHIDKLKPKSIISNDDRLGYIYWKQFNNDLINKNSSITKGNLQQSYVEDLIWLKRECENHFSIDTFAKKLYLQGKYEKLNLLKFLLSSFFTLLQNDNFDNRYDSFFASILDNLDELPKNIKILSWNYDYQLEIAFNNFSINNSLSLSRRKLNVTSKGDSDFKLQSTQKTLGDFSVFKINGTTNLKSTQEQLVDDVNLDELDLFSEIIDQYYCIKHMGEKCGLSFAWENEGNTNAFYSKVIASTMETNTLVVIGYSFPFFNRKIDHMILNNMRGLTKVYIQDPHNGLAIKERIESILGPDDPDFIFPRSISIISDMKDQFYLPFEL